MYLLIFSILFAVIEVSLLKILKKRNVNVLYTIVYSYVPSLICSIVMLQPNFKGVIDGLTAFYPILIILGLLLVTIFMIMVKSVEKSGIAITVISQRLSLSLPIIYSVIFFKEHLDTNGIIGIILAFISLALVMPINKQSAIKKYKEISWMYPVILFIGMGAIDIIYGTIAKLPNLSFQNTLVIGFLIASLSSPLIVKIFEKKADCKPQTILYGIVLGLVNFGAIYFFTSSLKYYSTTLAKVYIAQAVGVVTIASLVGIFFFREKLEKRNIIGLPIAIVAIWLLSIFKAHA